MALKPECLATAIGSLPHTDAEEAVDDVLRYLTDIPAWPQLPQRSFYETFCVQASEGLPSVRIDEAAEKLTVNTKDCLEDGMLDFYADYLSGTLDSFAISERYAAGLYELISRGGKYPYVKGQLPGPVTWGLTTVDQELKCAYYNDDMKDGIVKGLAKKAEWMAGQLSPLADEVIIFIDEPCLQSIGSAAVALHEDEVVQQLDEIIAAIHGAGAHAGIHCCGNTDWSLLTRTAADIISFDAWSYSQQLSLYPAEIGDYLANGGVIAWGIVPSSDEIDSQDKDSILAAFQDALKLLTGKGIDKELILEQALITPSCGAGTLTKGQALKILELTAEVSKELRK